MKDRVLKNRGVPRQPRNAQVKFAISRFVGRRQSNFIERAFHERNWQRVLEPLALEFGNKGGPVVEIQKRNYSVSVGE